jgi:hypothetical protein
MSKNNFNKVHWSSKSYNWDSPLDIFLELDEEFSFNLDPTNRPIHNLPGLDDALREPWFFSKKFLEKPPAGKRWPWSRVYDNPPYARGLIAAHVAKCIKEMRLKRVQLAVFLIPLRNSDYFKLLRKYGAEFRLCEKRLKFGDADGSSKAPTGAPFDSVIAVLQNPFYPKMAWPPGSIVQK